jgi:hypothetical protein
MFHLSYLNINAKARHRVDKSKLSKSIIQAVCFLNSKIVAYHWMKHREHRISYQEHKFLTEGS